VIEDLDGPVSSRDALVHRVILRREASGMWPPGNKNRFPEFILHGVKSVAKPLDVVVQMPPSPP